MSSFLQALSERRRFGIKPGLRNITDLCRRLGNPQLSFPAIHIAGTNGKGAVAAMLDACLAAASFRVGRYTSPHLVSLNERFFLNGAMIGDAELEAAAKAVADSAAQLEDITFFEALTAVAFWLYAREKVDYAVLECGLGGRLDATNVCRSVLSVITRIGLDHCDWLGDTVEKIAVEKAGIIKPGVPVVVGRNEPNVVAVLREAARKLGSPFHYAPDLAADSDIPASFSLSGRFNRENAITAIAAFRVLLGRLPEGLNRVVWPGRFQRVGNFIVDGAHNPPAARALIAALAEFPGKFNLIAGFCGDKDVGAVLGILAPKIARAWAVKTNNPRSLTADETAAKMTAAGMAAEPCATLAEALDRAKKDALPTLVCGSLFLAGEALAQLHAFPWSSTRFDPSERL